MGKRPDKQQPPSLDGMAIESFDDWMASYSEADELSIDALDLVSSLLQKADVDAKRRKIIWEDGQRLSITQSAERIHADHPDLSLDLIESKVVSWLHSDRSLAETRRPPCRHAAGRPLGRGSDRLEGRSSPVRFHGEERLGTTILWDSVVPRALALPRRNGVREFEAFPARK